MEKLAALPTEALAKVGNRLNRILLFSRFALVFVILFTIHLGIPALPESASPAYSLFTGPALATTICPDDPNPGGEPNPQPCKYACYTDKLTDNYVTKEDGTAWKEITLEVPDLHDGDQGTVAINENYVVDFSKLQGIFGATNSNYLEGNFQDDPHRKENIIQLNSQDFNKYHGPGEKIAAKTLVDDLKVKYVNYIYLNSHLPEASHEYTDIKNEGDPITIYQMITEKGFPNPPVPPAPGEDATVWLETWGKYWEKIPTSYSEFFRGELVFRYAVGEKAFDLIEKGELCPVPFPRAPIEFVMPEFQRTTSISDQLNQIVVPCAAQSFRHGDGPNPNDPDNCFRQYLANNPAQNRNASVLGKFIKACKDAINGASKTLIKKLRNTVQTSFKFLNPVKVALAADPVPSPSPTPCFKPLVPGKQGNAPFCALPEFTADGYPQLGPKDHCLDKSSPNKLDTDNPRVVCVFNLSWSRTYIASDNIPDDLDQRTDEDFDKCEDEDGDGDLECSITVKIWPVFRIPYLSEIWNNTLYSNEDEGEPGAGVGSPQKSGRPGVYSNFIPKAIYDTLFPNKYAEALARLKGCTEQDNLDDCLKLIEAINKCLNKNFTLDLLLNPSKFQEAMVECAANQLGRNLPGEVATGVLGAKSSVLGATSNDTKERFIGATDCSKFFTRDISLKPRALQKEAGIDKQECNLQAKAVPGEGDINDVSLPINCPASFTLTPHQATLEELQCYIVSQAAGQVEPKSGKDLARVMLNVMNDESSGDQCATAGAGEIGVFQYIASTWHSYHPDEIDSGSVNSPCWGVPGTDPYPTNPPVGYDINLFIWPSQFSGTNDGGAWNPFLQIDTTISVMLNGGACNWSTYKLRYGGC